MANIFPSYVTANPSFIMPELILQYSQASGFTDTLAGRALMPRLGDGDLYVYAKKIGLRTKVAAGQVAYNTLPSVTVDASMISTPTYLVRARAEYDHHDTQQAGVWGVSLPEAQRLGMRQAIFQQVRSAALFGMGNAGEGLLNTVGATSVNLPADSNGNTTVVSYDNGQMALFLLAQIGALKTRTMQIGLPARITVLAPQRVISAFSYSGVVQLTQFQRAGAGVATIEGMAQDIAAGNGDEIEFVCDDTLINAGAGGTTDAVIMVMPEVKKPVGKPINTNVFATLAPGLEATTLQLCDMVAPREIPTPLPGGAIDVLSELRVTPGWCIRPEALSIMSMQYQ